MFFAHKSIFVYYLIHLNQPVMNLISVKETIDKSQPLDFGSIFNRSIELFKKVWLQGFVTLLLTMLCIMPLYLIVYIPILSMGALDPEMLKQQEPPAVFYIFMIVFIPIFIIVSSTISIALVAAFYRICKQKDLDQMGKEDYFFFLKKGYLKKSFILGLITFGISLLGMLTLGIGIIYVMVPISLLPAFLAYNDELSPLEMVKASFALGNKNWLVIFGLIVVMGLIGQLGFILCFVGVFFTAMLSKIPTYYIYKDVFHSDEKLQSI